MKSKNVLIVVVLLAIIIWGLDFWINKHQSVANAVVTFPPTASTADWKTYTDTQDGLTFKYPSDSKISVSGGTFFITDSDPSDQLLITVGPVYAGFQYKGSIEGNTAELEQMRPGITSDQKVIFSNAVGYYGLHPITATGNPVPLIYIVTKNQIYSISYEGQNEVPFFQTFLSTMQFTQ